MRKICNIVLGVCWVCCCLASLQVYAAEKFEILPDLPEPLAAAQASSVSTVANDTTLNNITSQTIGTEPSLVSTVFSLLFVILLIYITGIIYAKLNNLGYKTLKKQIGDNANSKVSVVSTTALGSNKSLHVVELDGKRMLIGSSSNSISLIKDLGNFPPTEFESGEFSKIEIPNIRIPKIEIPKIEFPNIGFTKASPKVDIEGNPELKKNQAENDDKFEISDIYEENPDGIIDTLFKNSEEDNNRTTKPENEPVRDKSHEVDPDEYALYKKYL